VGNVVVMMKPLERLPKRMRREHWHGCGWSVQVTDGNGEAWLQFFPRTGTAMFHGDMTNAIANDIVEALSRAARVDLFARFTHGGPAEIIPFKRDDD